MRVCVCVFVCVYVCPRVFLCVYIRGVHKNSDGYIQKEPPQNSTTSTPNAHLCEPPCLQGFALLPYLKIDVQ